MEQSTEFMTAAAENSPEGLAAVLIAIVAVLFVVVKFGLPTFKELHEKKLEIERYRIEVDEKAAAALDDRERERIKTTQQQIASQNESNRMIETLASNQAAQTRIMEVLATKIDDSKDRSSDMGNDVKDMKNTANHIAEQVGEIHAIVVRKSTGAIR